jgi:hypothetical protein
MGSPHALYQLKEPPIFIVGAARSGTTWVFDIFNNHPRVAGAYETWLFTPDNGVGSLFSNAHWPPKRSGLSTVLARDELRTHVFDFTSSILSHVVDSDHHFLVEKSPSHIYCLELIDEIFPDARIVHVLRDGRDVAVSVRAAAESWMSQWRESFGRSIQSSARAWKHAVKRARAGQALLKDRFFEIRYEELNAEPIESYRKLFGFCQIPFNEELLRSIFEVTDFEKNYQRKESGFRRGGRVGDWRREFSLIDALLFNHAAGQMLIDLGYERDRKWMVKLTRPG